LVESAFHRELGFSVNCQDDSFRRDAYWFGESQSRVVVSVKKENLPVFIDMMKGMTFEKLGTVTDDEVSVDGDSWGSITEWKIVYDTVIEKEMASIVEA
jgi:phosphoribosylformylglycinamidine synthase